eukprot:Opistho-1_new@63477
MSRPSTPDRYSAMASRPKCVLRSSALKKRAVGRVVALPSMGSRRAASPGEAKETAEFEVPKSMPMAGVRRGFIQAGNRRAQECRGSAGARDRLRPNDHPTRTPSMPLCLTFFDRLDEPVLRNHSHYCLRFGYPHAWVESERAGHPALRDCAKYAE